MSNQPLAAARVAHAAVTVGVGWNDAAVIGWLRHDHAAMVQLARLQKRAGCALVIAAWVIARYPGFRRRAGALGEARLGQSCRAHKQKCGQ